MSNKLLRLLVPFVNAFFGNHEYELMQLHERSETLRSQISSLEVLCNTFNRVQHAILPIEQPLLQGKLDAVNAKIQSGLMVNDLLTGCETRYLTSCAVGCVFHFNSLVHHESIFMK